MGIPREVVSGIVSSTSSVTGIHRRGVVKATEVCGAVGLMVCDVGWVGGGGGRVEALKRPASGLTPTIEGRVGSWIRSLGTTLGVEQVIVAALGGTKFSFGDQLADKGLQSAGMRFWMEVTRLVFITHKVGVFLVGVGRRHHIVFVPP